MGNAGTKPREGALAAARALEAHAAAPLSTVTYKRGVTASRAARQPVGEPVLSASEAQALVRASTYRTPPPPVGLTELLRLSAADARG
jgi:hypothetical protein